MSDTSKILKMLRKHVGDQKYHPLCALLDLSVEPDASINEQITIHKSIAKYVEAEQRAVEVIAEVTSGVEFNFNIG